MNSLLAALLLGGPFVTVTPAPDGEALLAAYVLGEETASFVFAPNDTPQRADAWTPVGKGWTFDGQTFAREDCEPFAGFTVRMAPDPGFHDRRYVVASQVGEGWAFYLAALGGLGEPARVRFEGFGEDAVLRLPGHEGGLDAEVTTDGNDRRVAYVGPARHVRHGAVRLIAGPELPAWVAEALTADAEGVARVLEDRLGAPAAATPTVIASYDPQAEGFSFKGSALDGATMRLVMASDLSEADVESARALAGFTAHEMVHLWLNEVWDTTENASQPWLHEGAAEYIADRLSLEGEAWQAEAAGHVAACVEVLGTRPLGGSAGPIYGSVPYDRGVTLQLAAELTSRERREGDILDLWRAVTERAPDACYDSALFLNEARERGSERFAAVADAMLSVQGTLKPLALGAALEGVGIEVVGGEPDEADGGRLARLAMRTLQSAHCGGNVSYYSEPDGYRFALTEAQCGPDFPADAHVTGAQGVSLLSDGLGAYRALREACAEGGRGAAGGQGWRGDRTVRVPGHPARAVRLREARAPAPPAAPGPLRLSPSRRPPRRAPSRGPAPGA